jgi:hypothetical protein
VPTGAETREGCRPFNGKEPKPVLLSAPIVEIFELIAGVLELADLTELIFRALRWGWQKVW